MKTPLPLISAGPFCTPLHPAVTNVQPPWDRDRGDATWSQQPIFPAVAGDPEDAGTGEGGKLFFLVFMGYHVLFAGGGDNRGGSAHPRADVCWDNSGTGGSSIYQLP